MGSLPKDQYKFMADGSCREHQNTTFCVQFFYIVVYEIMWKHIVDPCSQQMTMWRMCIACLIPKVAYTHSEYEIPIAFLLQRGLHQRASILRYTYIARRVKCLPSVILYRCVCFLHSKYTVTPS
jgi:hypothetical protein